MWQGSLEVNLSVLIGSFLVGILPYSVSHRLCVFCLFSVAGRFKASKHGHITNHLLKPGLLKPHWGILALGHFERTSLRSVRTAMT